METVGIVREEWGRVETESGRVRQRGRVEERVRRGGLSGENGRHGKSAGDWGECGGRWKESGGE